MREIKFRAWVDDREGFIPSMLYDIPEKGDLKDFLGVHPIMQYTGLKDKNRKEIYEGDILKIQGEDFLGKLFFFLGEVIWNNADDFQIKNDKTYFNTRFGLSRSEISVIGNIYENPELLK